MFFDSLCCLLSSKLYMMTMPITYSFFVCVLIWHIVAIIWHLQWIKFIDTDLTNLSFPVCKLLTTPSFHWLHGALLCIRTTSAIASVFLFDIVIQFEWCSLRLVRYSVYHCAQKARITALWYVALLSVLFLKSQKG